MDAKQNIYPNFKRAYLFLPAYLIISSLIFFSSDGDCREQVPLPGEEAFMEYVRAMNKADAKVKLGPHTYTIDLQRLWMHPPQYR